MTNWLSASATSCSVLCHKKEPEAIYVDVASLEEEGAFSANRLLGTVRRDVQLVRNGPGGSNLRPHIPVYPECGKTPPITTWKSVRSSNNLVLAAAGRE